MQGEASYDFIVTGAGSAGCAVAGAAERGRPLPRAAARGRPARHLSVDPHPARLPQDSSTIRRSTGCSTASPSPSSTAASCTSRAARCWAAPARSTAWSICAATPPTTTNGASAAATAGTTIRVLPYFKRAEDNVRGGDEFHGTGGPLKVTDHRWQPTLAKAMHDAARRRPASRQSRLQRRQPGRRRLLPDHHQQLAALVERPAYLSGARQRKNLTIATSAHATRC